MQGRPLKLVSNSEIGERLMISSAWTLLLSSSCFWPLVELKAFAPGSYNGDFATSKDMLDRKELQMIR